MHGLVGWLPRNKVSDQDFHWQCVHDSIFTCLLDLTDMEYNVFPNKAVYGGEGKKDDLPADLLFH